MWASEYSPWKGTRKAPIGGLPYLPLEWGHIVPGVGSRIIALHGTQVIVVVTASHSVDVLAHDTHTQICVFLLQGLDLEPAIVPRVIPLEEMRTVQLAFQAYTFYAPLNTHTSLLQSGPNTLHPDS